MPDRNTSVRSLHRDEPLQRNSAPTLGGRNGSGARLHDQYRAIGISAVAAAVRWPDAAPGETSRKITGADRSAGDVPRCLRDID